MTELLLVKKFEGGGRGYISLAYAIPKGDQVLHCQLTGLFYTKDSPQEVSAQSVKK